MPGRLHPSEDPIAESVLEWTIKDSRDIRQLMVWMEESGEEGEGYFHEQGSGFDG